MPDQFHKVCIVGIGQIPVQWRNPASLRAMGSEALRLAMQAADTDSVDALFVGNMLADELQGQKHIAALIASAAGLRGIEALQVRAATGTGAAALRMAYLAVASGTVDRAIALGVEKMSEGDATPALAKALDAERETPAGATLLSQNARLMQLYLDTYGVSVDVFNNFPLTAHRNARTNPYALFRAKEVNPADIHNARVVAAPLRLYDAAPICDGAAAVLLVRSDEARAYTPHPVEIRSSSVATDWFCVEDRDDPLDLYAVRRSTHEALRKANIHRTDLDFIEVHDAFSIMSCLMLEATGYTARGQGWRLAVENQIGLDGSLPLSTMGGLKARGHPIGASALYQTCEIVQQLTGCAGPNQIKKATCAMLLSVGGVASTSITHVFSV
jgi:acetyl-CoA C-acetyltransferase